MCQCYAVEQVTLQRHSISYTVYRDCCVAIIILLSYNGPYAVYLWYCVEQVTLVGHSAGAQCTLIHMSLPTSQSLFHRAIIQSAPIFLPYKRLDEAILLAEMFTGKSVTSSSKEFGVNF